VNNNHLFLESEEQQLTHGRIGFPTILIPIFVNIQEDSEPYLIS